MALIAMEKAEFKEALAVLQNLIAEDFANRLQSAPHFLLICCHLRQGQIEDAETIFAEIPQTEEICDLFIDASPLGFYPLGKYLLEALNGLISNSSKQDIVGRVRGFRGIYSATRREADEGNADWELIKEDLAIALQAFPNDVNYNKYLGQVLSGQRDWVAAAKYFFLAQLNTDDEQYLELDFPLC